MFRSMLAAGFLGLSAATAAAQDVQASFDCAKASAPIEHAICSDAILAKIDADMAAIYAEALAQAADPEALRAEQRAWANERAAACAILPGADDDLPDMTGAQLDCLLELYTDRVSVLGSVAPAQGRAPDPAPFLNGMWQLAELIEARDPALKGAAQRGRIVRLDRHGLATLSGAGCAGPTLQSLSTARARPLDADERALFDRIDAAAKDGKDGVAGFCLGRLFALYLPAEDGSLLVADASALYRLQRLSAKP
ncbi:lysozyme inhibitor LprI family protein [Dongia sp.]|uniref:lysozyme inhibitor LprI family protein n=1 Tax=Dongia sp. TaxID=1977262 RepID=UPI0035B1CF01